MKYNIVEQQGGRGAGAQKGYLSSDHTESLDWCKVKDLSLIHI